jgi:alpha-galactosidase
MIKFKDAYFSLETKDLSYIFRIIKTGQLEHLYFGSKLIDENYLPLHTKITTGAGSSIVYEKNGHKTFLDLMPLEYSGIGKGDFRLSPIEIKMPNQSFVNDFVYSHHEIISGVLESETLPSPRGEASSLVITMKDESQNISLKLVYTAFYEANMIARKVIITNHNEEKITIRKIMSMMLDLPECDYDLYTFDGGWIKETHKHKRSLSYGTYSIESTTGASSNRHNPGIILAKKETHEEYGECYGINLMYSGNHYEAVEISNHGLLRVVTGINPHCFEWPLNINESFETPYAVLSYSKNGFNQLSNHFHHFVNHHVVPREFELKQRPIVINSWEAFYFDFNQSKLLGLAKEAKNLGIEMLVLDDGWFGNRNDDKRGLGDYFINKDKFPRGLEPFVAKIKKMGMKFGLWFEPEMINQDSELYRNHKDYAVSIQGKTPSLGRNQLVLDLCNKEVLAYIKKNIKAILDQIPIDFIKWDMNRHITDMHSSHIPNQGMFFHTYILGLYEILKDIQKTYPNILIETCSSGGNRFDLGMLTFGPQVWASDNTDPIERLEIQEGLSYLYPQSTISAHISPSPHAQTLRHTPIATRFNVASFGVLGYEYHLKTLSRIQKKESIEHIKIYKKYRDVFQFGKFRRLNSDNPHIKRWQVSKGDIHILGNYQTLSSASPNFEVIRFLDLDQNAMYKVVQLNEKLELKRFGHLISHALPIKLNPEGLIMRTIGKYKALDNATESFTLSGEALMKGYKLRQTFMGTGYDEKTRILGDYGSSLYVIEKR